VAGRDQFRAGDHVEVAGSNQDCPLLEDEVGGHQNPLTILLDISGGNQHLFAVDANHRVDPDTVCDRAENRGDVDDRPGASR